MLWKDDGILDTWPKHTDAYWPNPNQKQIEFFWPLTEQIPLDLDYTNAGRPDPQTIVSTDLPGYMIVSNGSICNNWVSTELNSDSIKTNKVITEEITFTLNKKPFIIKRMLLKLLGIKWKIR
jgi:hypothetical protein